MFAAQWPQIATCMFCWVCQYGLKRRLRMSRQLAGTDLEQ